MRYPTRERVLRGTYTPAEAATRLGISRSHVYELVQTGELPAVKLGAAVRIPVQYVETMLENPVAH